MASSLLSRIPKIDRLKAQPAVRLLIERHGNAVVLDAMREATGDVRRRLLDGENPEQPDEAILADLVSATEARVEAAVSPSLRGAINATGVVLHTGLGRAVLADAAARAIADIAVSHSLLEIDPVSGERGSRLDHVSGLLRRLTGAGDALVVNNNAAAVSLAIAALAGGREVVISRGQLVEIGGSFRIPDVIRQAGARLVEVGATNKVRLGDYQAACGENTALILRVHPSNFRIVGFTEEPSLDELVDLGRRVGVPVMDDLGSGALVDLRRYGLVAEPTVQESVRAGAGVVTFSGDKLLGGPQAGLVVGDPDLLARMKRHPLMRVLRVDKLTMAGLAATLRLYLDEGAAVREIPTLQALTAPAESVARKARRLRRLLAGSGCSVELAAGASQVGGGSLPGEELPTTLVCITARSVTADELARRLRAGAPPVFARIARDSLTIDPRTVREGEIPALGRAVRAALEAPPDEGRGNGRRATGGPGAGERRSTGSDEMPPGRRPR